MLNRKIVFFLECVPFSTFTRLDSGQINQSNKTKFKINFLKVYLGNLHLTVTESGRDLKKGEFENGLVKGKLFGRYIHCIIQTILKSRTREKKGNGYDELRNSRSNSSREFIIFAADKKKENQLYSTLLCFSNKMRVFFSKWSSFQSFRTLFKFLSYNPFIFMNFLNRA